MIGRSISQYPILERIGASSLGEVYSARDGQRDRDISLKVLPAGALADEAAQKQFRKLSLLPS